MAQSCSAMRLLLTTFVQGCCARHRQSSPAMGKPPTPAIGGGSDLGDATSELLGPSPLTRPWSAGQHYWGDPPLDQRARKDSIMVYMPSFVVTLQQPLLEQYIMFQYRKALSREAIARCIAQGELIIVYEGCVLQLGAWINHHPGGRLAILHMVGRDATDEINIYHSSRALLMLKRYIIGRVDDPWVNMESPVRLSRSKDGISGQDSWKMVSAPTGLHSRYGNDTIMKDEKLHRVRLAADIEDQEQRACLQRSLPVDAQTQQAIAQDYRALHEQIKAAGLYQCRYSMYAIDSIRCSLLFGGFFYLLRCEWYATSSLFLGMFWHQIMFVAHDAGHRSITSNSVTDTLIGACIAGLCCGMSISWWKASHNIHHLVTNMPEHDPDIQNLPFFSTSPAFSRNITSTFYRCHLAWTRAAELLLPYQQYTYFPMMAVARFNMYALNWLHVCSPRAAEVGAALWVRAVELVFMACYWGLFSYLLVWCTLPSLGVRIIFVAISHMVTMLLHVQFTLAHWGMPTCDLGPTESFAQHQLRTTMDIECPEWLDWFYGGLQFQVAHHLFPRLPRHNLRRAQVLVRRFCEKTSLRYHCYGVKEGNKIVLSRLGQIAKMVEMMVACQQAMAAGTDDTLQKDLHH